MATPPLNTELLRLRALAEASRLVFSSLDLDELLDNILKAATSMIGAARGTVYLCDHDRRELWSRVTSGSDRVEIRLPFGHGMAGHTAVSGEPLRVDDVRETPLFDPETDRRTGFKTVNALCMPIRDREGRIVAVLQLLNKPTAFNEADTEFLDLMAVQVAQALANAQAQQVLLERQRLQKEMEVAARIQTLLLPRGLPNLPGLELAGRMLPCAEIGGDYYDAIPLAGGRTLVVLADVSGKGIPAALVMSNFQAALWATADLGLELEACATHLNDLLTRRLEGRRYVTAFLLLVEAGGRRARYVNAGHPPALVRRRGGMLRLDATGAPLGLLADYPYAAANVELGPGDTLLLYSDGLTEAWDAADNELGVDGPARLFAELPASAPSAAVDRLLAEVEAYADPARERDDRTLVVLASAPA